MGGSITDVAGVLLGHEHDPGRGSGITVLLFPRGAAGVADIRGEAAGTRQMDSLLRPHPVRRIHALVLSGGSAFGLDSAAGVMRFLEERGVGFSTAAGVIPIVPTAVIYDLWFGDPAFRPGPEMAYSAAERASAGLPASGSVGAGAGATVGKIFGISRAMKGGFGTSSERAGGTTVGACAVVNAFGDVFDPGTGKWLAGARTADGSGASLTEEALAGGFQREPFSPGNTTLGVVATDEELAREELAAVARMAHGAMFRAIRPVHTPMDGDIVVALSTGASGRKGNPLQTAVLAERSLGRAIADAVEAAEGGNGIPCARDMRRRKT
ncbi:MAG TPA: P1 family peptidase [Candidatus Aquicultoraceae bacterium]|jgi:L-aminopeptidase/D-esterase-like protein|nr:P1 family peptidase [Candidatus Aquicultoraceae bacterium]